MKLIRQKPLGINAYIMKTLGGQVSGRYEKSERTTP